jgi:CheY-like chemotaxis protein
VADPPPDPAPPAGDAADDELRLRARALGVLAGSAWHELAQPLGGLRSFATMLQVEGLTAEQLGVEPALVEDAAATAERLARAFTDLARGGGRPGPLKVLVEDVLAVAGNLTVDVDLVVDIPDDAPEPDVDPGVLRVVVASLLVDALDALGGPRHARGSLRWRATSDDRAVTLLVGDSGVAATPASLPEIERVLGAHGASIRHETAPGRGNRTTLVLPLDAARPVDADAADAAAAASTEPVPPSGAVLTVLVCDDDAVIRNLILRTLARQGVATIAAGSGAEAIALIERSEIDVILCDERMPGMTGRALHAVVCATRPELGRRFVLMSGDSGDADLAAFAREEDVRVLGKPFDLGRLAEVLREAASR